MPQAFAATERNAPLLMASAIFAITSGVSLHVVFCCWAIRGLLACSLKYMRRVQPAYTIVHL